MSLVRGGVTKISNKLYILTKQTCDTLNTIAKMAWTFRFYQSQVRLPARFVDSQCISYRYVE